MVKSVDTLMINGTEMRVKLIEPTPPTPTADRLCFTANTAGSTVKLRKSRNPTEVSLEISTDGTTWTDYTIGDTITLSNIGDKVYWRNKSETDTRFSINSNNCYKFQISGNVVGSGDCSYLLNKNGTDTMSEYCFYDLFYQASGLTIPPKLGATTLAKNCYDSMFARNSNLIGIPKLPATILPDQCYANMFVQCSSIKLSATQNSDYTQEYRIPTTGTGVEGDLSLQQMFVGTGGTFRSTPTINTTYYLHKDNVIV